MSDMKKREFQDTFINGALDDPSVLNHQYRDKSQNANIYVRKYMPDKERS